MAGDDSGQVSWHLSGGTNQSDGNASLGGVRSNHQVRNRATTVQTNGSAGDKKIELAIAHADYGIGFLYIRDGASGGFFTRGLGSDGSSPGFVDLLDPLPAAVTAGDQVWVYVNRAGTGTVPWSDGGTSALESANGFTQSLGFYVLVSGTINDARLYFELENPGTVLFELAAGDNAGSLNTKVDREAEPDLSGMVGGGSSRFSTPRTPAEGTPIYNVTNQEVPFWVRKTGPANALRQSLQAIAVVLASGSTVISKAVLPWPTVGFTPTLALNHAPTLYLAGGARYKATVTSVETGLRVPGVDVGFAQTVGPGLLTPSAAGSITDANGEALAAYAAPTDPGDVGETVTVEASL